MDAAPTVIEKRPVHKDCGQVDGNGFAVAGELAGACSAASGNLKTLSGGRWSSWKSVAVDLGIALPFWVLWEGSAYGVHWLLSGVPGTSSAKSVDSLLPQSLLEISFWMGASVTAGVCEE